MCRLHLGRIPFPVANAPLQFAPGTAGIVLLIQIRRNLREEIIFHLGQVTAEPVEPDSIRMQLMQTLGQRGFAPQC